MSFAWGLALGKMYIGYVAYSIYSSLLPVAELAMKHAFLVGTWQIWRKILLVGIEGSISFNPGRFS